MTIKLRVKVLLIFAIGLLLLLAVQYVTARMVILEQVGHLEEEKARDAIERIHSLFEDHSAQLASVTSDWASWNDTYRFMADGNQDYLDSNYTQSTFTRLKINAILLLDLEGRLHHGHGVGGDPPRPWAIPQPLQDWVQRAIAALPKGEGGINGFLSLAGENYQISVQPILNSEGEGPLRGVFAMVRRLDERYLANLSKIAHFPLSLHPLTVLESEVLSPEQQQLLLRVGHVLLPRESASVAYLLVKDPFGQPAMVVRTVMDRKIYQQGQSSLHLLLVSTLVILFSLVGFSLFFDRTVLQPVARLSAEISQVGIAGEHPMRVTPLPGRCELSELTTGINAMLQRLEIALTDLRQSREKLRLVAHVMENSNDLIVITDASNHIIMVNKGFCRISGYTPEEVIGKSPRMLRSGQHDGDFYADMWRILLKEGYWHGELWNRRKNGEYFPEWLTISMVRNEQGEVENFFAIGADLTDRKEADRRMALLTNHDHLTQLPNRTLLYDRLSQAILNARIYHRMAAILLMGLDRFKHLNDSLGHGHGDEVLRQVASRLREGVPRDATAARISGDTFAIVLSFHDPGLAVRVANGVLESIAQPLMVGEHEVVLTATIGISLFPTDGDSADDLLRHGEQAMFRAKEQGRNLYSFYETHMQEDARERFVLENSLRRAVENNELILFYQPQYDMTGQRMVGAEALIRWQHPQLGMVSPGKFIPVAEESGLVVPIGSWVLETACRQIKSWQQAGLPVVMVAVNVSALQFRKAGFVDFVATTLRESGLDPALLELEVTESLLIQDIATTVTILNQLKALGLRLAIDDFGTGYSSLHYLNRFPLDKLKVDQSFVRGLPDYEDNAAITTAIIQLAHSLRLRVIAEGVESEQERAFLHARGCDEVQGYLFSRPLPVAAFEKKLVGAAKEEQA